MTKVVIFVLASEGRPLEGYLRTEKAEVVGDAVSSFSQTVHSFSLNSDGSANRASLSFEAPKTCGIYRVSFRFIDDRELAATDDLFVQDPHAQPE